MAQSHRGNWNGRLPAQTWARARTTSAAGPARAWLKRTAVVAAVTLGAAAGLASPAQAQISTAQVVAGATSTANTCAREAAVVCAAAVGQYSADVFDAAQRQACYTNDEAQCVWNVVQASADLFDSLEREVCGTNDEEQCVWYPAQALTVLFDDVERDACGTNDEAQCANAIVQIIVELVGGGNPCGQYTYEECINNLVGDGGGGGGVDAALEMLADQGDTLDAATNLNNVTALSICPAEQCGWQPADNRSTWYFGSRQACQPAHGDAAFKDQDNRSYWSNEHWNHKRGNEFYVCSEKVNDARTALLDHTMDVVSGTYHSATNVEDGYGVGGPYGSVKRGYAGCFSHWKSKIEGPAMIQEPNVECIYQYGK